MLVIMRIDLATPRGLDWTALRGFPIVFPWSHGTRCYAVVLYALSWSYDHNECSLEETLIVPCHCDTDAAILSDMHTEF